MAVLVTANVNLHCTTKFQVRVANIFFLRLAEPNSLMGSFVVPFRTDACRAAGASGAVSAIHTAHALLCTSRRRLPLRASQGDDLSQFPRYNNADDDIVIEGAPVVDSRRLSSKESLGMAAGLPSMAGLSGHPAVDDACMQQVQILSSFCEDDMTPALKERVYHVMLGAFSEVRADRRPTNAEVLTMLNLLWQQGPDAGKQGDSLKQLVALTTTIELLVAELRQVDGALEERGGEGEGGEVDDAGTPSMAPVSAALRDARARVLVYARDGYMYDPRRLAFWTSFLFGFVP